MNMISGYIYLALAIIFGVLSSGYLKTTDNFTNLIPTIFCILTIISCIYCLSKTMNILPVGFAYASYGGSANFEMQFKVEKRATPTWSLEGNASWAGATPNAYESKSSAIFQHNGGTLFALSDASQDLCGSFSAEL